jgi:hypothetical protein
VYKGTWKYTGPLFEIQGSVDDVKIRSYAIRLKENAILCLVCLPHFTTLYNRSCSYWFTMDGSVFFNSLLKLLNGLYVCMYIYIFIYIYIYIYIYIQYFAFVMERELF